MIGNEKRKATANGKIVHQPKNFQLEFNQLRTGMLRGACIRSLTQ